MPRLLAPGPVFLYESIAASRRWQAYALRALLVAGLLQSLWLAWFSAGADDTIHVGDLTRVLAEVGVAFYKGAAGILVALALLVAPAASAGSICVDRARGWLTHAFVTDLSDAEIVLGKLASRYLSAAGLVLTGLPVFLLVSLLGGIVPEALFVLAAVTLLVLLLGCSLSMAVSSRATKSHEVLLVVFGSWAVWIFGPTIWRPIAELIGYPLPPEWLDRLNPFFLVYAAYSPAWAPIGADLAIFAAACLGISAAAVLFTVRSLRGDAGRSPSLSRRIDAALDRARARLGSWWPAPSLDDNPVLWREWRINRPAWYARAIFALFALLLAVSMGVGLYEMAWLGNGWFEGTSNPFIEWVSVLAALLGLLLLGASAPTSLAEERLRGSLDLLMGTPLSTREIVMGKWRAAFARSFPFLLFTAAAGGFIAFTAPARPSMSYFYYGSAGETQVTIRDRCLAAVLPSTFLIAHAAAITSVGVLSATWIRRTGRAVAACVTTVVLFSAGWELFGQAALPTALAWLLSVYSYDDGGALRILSRSAAALGPLGGQMAPYRVLTGNVFDRGIASYGYDAPSDPGREAYWLCMLGTLSVILLFAAALLGLTLLTFNRCMGRMNEQRPLSLPRPPRRATRARASEP
ncbi:ABC-2 family transporter protein [Aquisphaera giovannonii]|uniref:ABC-2 family transporter protein n=1 Tax=Aquisphaera giovannonii TaxID=406548 RepID=A0A5B9W2A3_9BACT|nr:ABC transporter permease subunit [Aquisphaera giovannonii]QEH34251.1 ABC-2 family transporter protein [Aquisphaera giovannonii]